jgi:hypothetical protein
MAGRKKQGSTPGNNGKQSKPRRGEKAKQVKAAQAKETETKGIRQGIRQTKIAFATTGTLENAKDPPANDHTAKQTEQSMKLTFAEVTRTPQKVNEAQDTTHSTAITPAICDFPKGKERTES